MTYPNSGATTPKAVISDNWDGTKTFPTCFSPAIALMSRLSYAGKFVLLKAMTLVALAVVVYSLSASLYQLIDKAQREISGLALMKPISQTVQALQEHRGLSAGYLGGIKSMREKRSAKEREASEAFAMMAGKLPPSLIANTDFQNIKTDLERLLREGLHWTAADNFAVHTRLIEQILLYEVVVADEYELTLDPDFDTYYLVINIIEQLPATVERIARIRTYGTGILAQKQATERQKAEMNGLIAQLGDALKILKINLRKVGRDHPAIRSSISATSQNINIAVHRIIDAVTTDILADRFAMSSEDFFMVATGEIDKVYAELYGTFLPECQSLLEERIVRVKTKLYTSVGIALLLFLSVIYFTAGIGYAITGNIQSLVRSARAFVGGNRHERIHLVTRDELSQVGDSFNTMAEEFNALLESRIENESRLRATLDTALDGVVQMDSEGIIIGWNFQAEKIFGWKHSEAVGQAVSETIIPPRYRQAHAQGVKLFLLSGEGSVLNSRIEVTGLKRDGREFPLELSISHTIMAGKHEFNAFARDLTERKKAEEEIYKLLLAIEQTPLSVVITNKDGDIQYVNRKFCEVTGYPKEEVLEKNPRILKSGEHPQEFYKILWDTILEGREWRGEFHDKKKNGELYWESANISPIKNAQGDITHFIAVKEDITEKKRLIEILSENEEKYRLFFMTEPDAIILTDLETMRITDANDSALRLYQYDRDEFIGLQVAVISAEPEKTLKALEGTKLVGVGKIPLRWHRKKDGTAFPVEINYGAFMAKGRKTVFSACRDISERFMTEKKMSDHAQALERSNALLEEEILKNYKYAQELEKHRDYLNELVEEKTSTLKLSNELLSRTLREQETIFAANPDIIYMADMQANMVKWNKKLEAVTGYAWSHLFGKKCVSLFSPGEADEVNQTITKIFAEGWAELEAHLIGKSGDLIPYQFNGVPLRNECGEVIGFTGTGHDITARKQAEERLKKVHDQMIHSEKLSALGKLTGSIAHEFNNPIYGVRSIIEQVLEHMAHDEEFAPLLTLAIKECNRMSDLVKKLQGFYKPSQGIALPLDIHQVLDEVCLLAKKKLQVRRIKLEKKYCADLPTIVAVEDQLKQVFLNLLNNAEESFPKADVGMSEAIGKITVITQTDFTNVQISFQDTGEGIPPENLPMIFEPFFSTKAVKGTGLGLSISYGIVKMHGGDIEVSSKPGKGTTFMITLPIIK